MIRLPLPIVEGNRDYRQREAELRRMDEILVRSGVEAACMAQAITAAVALSGAQGKPLSDRRRESLQRQARQGAALHGGADSQQ